MTRAIILAGTALLAVTGCHKAAAPPAETPPMQVELAAGPELATELQAALIAAAPGSTVILPAGTFSLTDGLSLDIEGVTLRGAGQTETILDFSGQTGAGEGLLVTSAGVTLSDFTIRDTAGDGIKSKDADRITYRDLTVEWSGGPDESNGAYGVYPVESRDVLIDGVTVRGASDAGIYVGQSENIIVRNSLAELNVAGIEIENSAHADVYGNTAMHNAGGILVFDLPDLPVIGGNSTRIFDNDIRHNDTPNFAPPGNIVAGVPSGTGLIVMANDNVHVFGNRFAENRTAHIIISAYQDSFTDTRYNPLPRNVVIHDNSYESGGNDPQGMLGEFAAGIGGKMPPIVWDGVTQWPGHEAVNVNLSVTEDADVGYLSLGIGSYPLVIDDIMPSALRPEGRAPDAPQPVSLPQDG